MDDKKIISLLPAATEMICSLGLEALLVGRSHECDFPPSILRLPVCSAPQIDSSESGNVIDSKIREIVLNALSVYALNEQLIKDLKPDTIITQSQCEVCAVTIRDVELALNDLVGKPNEIISLEPRILQHIFKNIELIAEKFDAVENGKILLEELEERIDLIRHKLKFIDQKPKVACIEWLSPLMISGNWIPEVVEIAGGEPILKEPGKPSTYIEFDDLISSDPDFIVIMPCGFSIERSLKEIDLLLQMPGWTDLKAVKNNKIYIADGNHYFNRPGPRIVDSIEILAEILYPKQFAFGFEGNGWLHFNLQ